MLIKLLIVLMIPLLKQNSVSALTRDGTSPDTHKPSLGNYIDYNNYIPETSQTSHITGIELGLLNNGAFYTFNVLGDGVARTPQPSDGCTLLTG